MKNIFKLKITLFSCVLALCLITNAYAQLTGTKNIPGDYGTLALAISDLNTQGVGPGGVTINLVAGNPQTAPAGGYIIGGTGTAILTTTSLANQVTFTGNGNTITAFGGQTVGALNDAIFKLVGADWVTIQNFTIQENGANLTTAAASNNMTEWGVALLYESATNGSQNNRIQNNIISLNRTYTNTFGVYSNVRHTAAAPTVAAEITNVTGSNFGNKVYGNAISNVNYSIAFFGSGSTTPGLQDNGNDIGGVSGATANTITNSGGIGILPSAYVGLATAFNYQIVMYGQYNDNISFNSITSFAATITASVTSFGGILKFYPATQPTGTITSTINSNTVTLTLTNTGTACGTVGINNQGLTPLLSTATININNNTVLNCTVNSTVAVAGLTGITSSSLPGILNMTGNTVRNNTVTNTTGTFACIVNSGAAGTVNITGNTIRGNSFGPTTGQYQGIISSGAVTTAINLNNNFLGDATAGFVTYTTATAGNLFGVVNAAGAAAATLSIQGNDVRGIVNNVASTGNHFYINNQIFTGSTNINNNTITNLNVNTTGATGGIVFISNNVLHAVGTTHNVNNNSIVGTYTNNSACTFGVFFYNAFATSGATVTEINNGNNFSNLTFTGATLISGWRSSDGTTPGSRKTVTNNTFNNITNGAGSMTLLNVSFADNAFPTNNVSGNTITNINGGLDITGIITTSGFQNIFSNNINTLTSTGASLVRGIAVTGGNSQNVFRNKIYNLSGNNAGSSVSGIMVSGGGNVGVYNNLIGDLRATAASSATDVVRGINLTSAIANASLNISNNSIYLDATSSGANFSTSGIFHTTSATATTATLNMRNNIIVNVSVPAGTGITAAYRRSTTALNNFGSVSNNNLLYAGTPGAANLIYYDGTNSDQTLAAYQTRVAPLDVFAVTENPPFLSTTGSNANFLHLNTAISTQAESKGVPIFSITDDFDGNTRHASSPDIGADEDIATTCSGTPTPGTITSLGLNPCNGDYLSLSGYSTGSGLTFQWEYSTDNVNFFPIFGAGGTYFVTFGGPQTTYYRVAVTCSANTQYSNTHTAAPGTGGATPVTTGDTRCGNGVVNLSATGNGGTLIWTPTTAGQIIAGAGATYSPTVTTSGSYIVREYTSLTTQNIGYNGTGQAPVGYFSTTAQWVPFDVLSPSGIIINSVQVFSSSAVGTPFTIALQDAAGTTFASVSGVTTFQNIPATIPTNPQTVNLNFFVPQGNAWRLVPTTNPNFAVHQTGAGIGTSIIPNVLINYGYGAGTGNFNNTSGFFYNWSVSSGCIGAPSIVNYVVNPPPALTITPSGSTSFCGAGSINLTASGTGYVNFAWSPPTGLSGTSGATVTAFPSVTTTYTVNADDGGGPTGCASTQTVTITVHGPPSANATASSTTVCIGGTSNLNSNGASSSVKQVGTVLNSAFNTIAVYDNFNSNVRTQILYTAAELNAVGLFGPTNITSIAFNVVNKLSTGSLSGFTISMAGVANNPPLNNTYLTPALTTVFTGTVATVLGWNTHTFTTPFAWNGTSNVLVQICNGVPSVQGFDQVANTPTASFQTIQANLLNCTSTTGSPILNRPNTRFTGGTVNFLWSPNDGNLSAVNITNPVFTGNSLGSFPYSVLITDPANGCTATSSVTVGVVPPPAGGTVTGPATGCAGVALASLSETGGSGNFQWQVNINSAGFNDIIGETASSLTYTPLSGGTHEFRNRRNAGGCADAFSSNTITVAVGPVITVSSTTATPANVCPGSSTQLNVSASGDGDVSGSYCTTALYTTGCTDATPDEINDFTISNLSHLASGCSGGAAGYGDFTSSQPAILLSQNTNYPWTIICPFANSENVGIWIDLNKNGSFADAGEFFGNVGPSVSSTITGTLNVGSAASGTYRMRVRLVFGTAQALTTSCTGYTFGEIHDYKVSIGNGGWAFNYSWTPAAGLTPSANVANPVTPALSSQTVYTVTITELASGCSSTASVTVVLNAPPDPFASSNAPVCEGVALDLFGDNFAVGQAIGNSWSWSGPSFSSALQNPSIAVSSAANAGTYTLTVTNSDGCTATTSTDVTVNPNPVLSIASQTNVSCNGLSDGSIDIDATSGTAPFLFDLVGPSTANGIFTGLAAGPYTATVIDDNGCTATPLPVTITEPPVLTVGAGSNTPVCTGTSLNLSATPVGGTSGYSYAWTGPNGPIPAVQNPTIASATAADAGNYSVQVTDANLCTATSGNHLVQVTTSPTAAIALVGSPNKCLGQSATVQLTFTGTGPWNYTISGNGGPYSGTTSNNPENVNVTPIAAGVFNYTVTSIGNTACPTGGTSSGSATVNVSTAPPPSSGPIPAGASEACAGTVMLITSNVINGQNIIYSWNTGSNSSAAMFSTNIGGPFSPGPFQTTTNQVYVQFGALGGGQSGYHICLQGVNGCGSSINKCLWLRGVVSGPGAITPANAVVACPNDVKSYSCGASGGASLYNWTLSGSSAPITSGQGTTNVQVTFPPAFTSGQLCVTAALACGGSSTSPARCMTINKNPANPNVPTGAATVCPGATGVSYSIAAVSGATGYNWTVPANATIATGTNSPSITVNFPTPYNGSSSVCVTTTSACGASAVKCKTVASGIPAQPAGITGPLTNVCGSTVQYSVVNPVASSYAWTNPAGTTISGSATGSTILLNVSSTFTSGVLTVVANSTLCAPATSAVRTSGTIWGRPNNPGAITANPVVWCSGGGVNFSITPEAPLPTYTWTVSNGTIDAGQGSNNIDVTWGATAAGTVSVRAGNGCGLSAGTSSQSFSSGCREEGINASADFSVYPNPAHDKVTVSIEVKESADFTMQLMDLSGRVIISEGLSGSAGLNMYDVDLSHVSKGVYTLELKSAGDNWKTKVVVQ